MSEFEDARIDHQPIKKQSLYIFSFILLFIFIVLSFHNKKNIDKPETEIKENLPAKTKSLSRWDIFLRYLQQNSSKYWKINKVNNFYRDLTPIVMQHSLETGVPPGAILAIASLESGYGTGYIANVSGNILSLNARNDEFQLPPLTVPVNENGEIIISNGEIQNMLAAGKPLNVSSRPPSLKKDYRPENIAGTDTFLDYFLINPQEKLNAWKRNVTDLLYGRLKPDSSVPAYRDTYQFINSIKKSASLKRLFSNKNAKTFLEKIGGKPHSYNIRKSWVIKCQQIIDKIEMEFFLHKYYKQFYNSVDKNLNWKDDI